MSLLVFFCSYWSFSVLTSPFMSLLVLFRPYWSFSVLTSPFLSSLVFFISFLVLFCLFWCYFFPYYSCSFPISLFILFRLSVFLCPYAVQCFVLERRVKGINYSSVMSIYLLMNYSFCRRQDICAGSILLARICQQMFFAIVAEEIIEKKLCKKITYKCRKNRKNNKSNKIQDLEREKAKKDTEKSANVAKIAKVTRIFLVS